MSRFREAAAAILALGLLGFGGCRPRPPGVVDRPELSEAMNAARQAPEAEMLWDEWTAPPSDGHYYATRLGDLDGNGIPDLVAGSFDPGGVAIWVGRRGGGWEYSFVALPSSEVRDLVTADADGDGRDEILIVSRGGVEGLLILRAPEDGPWGVPEEISSTEGYESIAAGDIDGDGAVDLVTARGGDRTDGGIELWTGDGRGGFRNGQAPLSGGSFRHALVQDVDGDGRLDVVAAGWGYDGGIRVFLGDGGGAFTPGAVLGVPGDYRRVAAGDVDGNGRLDLVATTYRSGVRMFPDFDPRAEPCAPIESGSFWSPLVTDGDGDGRSEIYASSSNGLGVLGWQWTEACEFAAVPSGLPDRDVWFGLTLDALYAGEGPTLIVSGLTDGIRVFAPAGGSPPAPGNPRLVDGPDAAEERWADGNDTFVTRDGAPEYRMGVGDVVRIRVFNGESVEESEAEVQSDGELFVPARGIGAVSAGGQSPAQVKRVLLERAAKVWREPQVEVVVLEHRAHRVSLLGEIRSTARADSGPGRYALEGRTRVVDFLSKHGGPTDRADLNHVQVIQPDGRSSYLNIYRAVLSSDPGENPILNDGDTVFVPSIEMSNRRLIVLGEVNEPGMIELRDNITLLEAIARAGGFNPRAFLQNVVVIRGGLESPEVTVVDVREALENGDLSANTFLRSGDIVYVPQRRIVHFNQVMNAIQPVFDLILDALIIKQLAKE